MVSRRFRSLNWLGTLAAACVLLAGAPDARADTIQFATDYEPNVINLWSSVPFSSSAISNLTGTWGSMGWIVSENTGSFVQLDLPSGYGNLNFSPVFPPLMLFNINFNGTTSTNSSWAMDWQEAYYTTTPTTNTFVEGFAGQFDGSPTGIQAGTYGSVPGLGPTGPGGAPLYMGPVGPEPSSLLAFGLALACAAVARRRA